jgi:hypothetical protein
MNELALFIQPGKETGSFPCVACRSDWLRLDENGIGVTVDE